jgi:Flp pilus assembly pilin Flp
MNLSGFSLLEEGAMNRAVKLLWTYAGDDRAATAIEYGLIAGGISIAACLVLLQVGVAVVGIFEQIHDMF